MKCVSQVIGPKNVDILYIKNLFLQKLINHCAHTVSNTVTRTTEQFK